uniref:UBC core domain-containing protein n=1 Tax=Marmota marmota marmota TaxID=9994 RepID=A0A8C5YY34_MARMA
QSSKRLQKELLALQNDPPPGMTLNEKSVQNSITQWIVDMEGAPGTLYEGEKFQLLFKFSSRYPFDSPQVIALLFKILMYFYVILASGLQSCYLSLPSYCEYLGSISGTKKKKKKKRIHVFQNNGNNCPKAFHIPHIIFHILRENYCKVK